jgi:hypothetical protein
MLFLNKKPMSHRVSLQWKRIAAVEIGYLDGESRRFVRFVRNVTITADMRLMRADSRAA